MGVVMAYGFYKLGQGIKEQKYVFWELPPLLDWFHRPLLFSLPFIATTKEKGRGRRAGF